MATGNGFSEEQQAFIRQVAFAVLAEAQPVAFKLHTAECPHGRSVTRWKFIAIGILLGGAIFGVSGGVSAAALILRMAGG